MEIFNNTPDDDDLIGSIMDSLGDSSDETTEESEVTEEAEAGTQEVTEEAETKETETEESHESGEGESQEEIESPPATKNQVNKIEGFKAMRAKMAEKDGLIAQLKEKLEIKDEEESQETSETGDKKDFFTQLAGILDKKPEEVEAAFKAKEAETAGMSLEAYEKFNELDKKLKSIEAEKASASKVKEQKALAKAIDGFIESTGISNEKDVTNFFVKAKEEFGFDFITNPNTKAMVAVFNGMDKKDFKETLEQETLLKIKNGETPDVDSQSEESQIIAKQKKQKEKDDEDYKK